MKQLLYGLIFFLFKVSDGDNSFAYYMYYAYGVKSAILS